MTIRKTAVLRISRPGPVEIAAPLDREREYAFELRVDNQPATGGSFTSTLGDEKWTTFIQALNRATAASDEDARKMRGPLTTVRDAGRSFYDYVSRLAPSLTAFLEIERGPRRLVVESSHAEIHKLPWEAMVRPDWRIPEDGDLSIVHTKALFRSDPAVCQTPLRVAAAFGPNTGKTTADALTDIRAAAGGRIQIETWQTGKAGAVPDADIYHVEAHGSRDSGAIDIDEELGNTTPFADRLRDRAMVLLWSCHSALSRSWGASPALTLNERGNALVVAFQTELNEDSAADISSRFYRDVFTNLDVADPETAIVRSRLRLYTDRLNSCEWAALAIWLRQPIDVTAATVDGPRLPERSWSDVTIASADLSRLKSAIDDEAHPGRPLLLAGVNIPPPLPRELVAASRGMVVHLDGDLRSGGGLDALVQAVGLTPSSAHPADSLLSVIEVLAKIPDSLLLWSGVGDHQQRAASLISIPSGLRVVLTSPLPLPAAEGVFNSMQSAASVPAMALPAGSPLEQLESLERAGRYLEAYEIWDRQQAAARSWPQEQQKRFWMAGYWIGLRLEDELGNLERCLNELAPLAPFEVALLRGSLLDRSGHYDRAARQYAEAQRIAQTDTQRGWLRVELAYLASHVGDVALAEAHYRAAFRLLESVREGDADPQWRSAISRGLRDYAHLLARDRNRATEAAVRLNRAIAMHAIDGRLGQLPAALTTRGRIERALERWDRAERALMLAVGLEHEADNLRGWASSVQQLFQLHFDAGRYDLALQLVATVYTRLDTGGDPLSRPAAGLAAFAAARAAWRLGRFDATRTWIDKALERLPPERRDERLELDTLGAAVRSLSSESPAPDS